MRVFLDFARLRNFVVTFGGNKITFKTRRLNLIKKGAQNFEKQHCTIFNANTFGIDNDGNVVNASKLPDK